MDKATANGLKAVRRIAEELDLDGYYGPLYELFSVSDAYRTAAEVTAGTSLFHIVVDNDNTASQILDAMIRQRAGRVTFMPLNRLRVKPVNYPQTDDAADDDDRVVPLCVVAPLCLGLHDAEARTASPSCNWSTASATSRPLSKSSRAPSSASTSRTARPTSALTA
jgi:hypothetical protein